MSFLYSMINDRSVVDELFQETFLKLYRSRESYEKRAKFSTYLWTIAKHTALDWIEKKKEVLATHSSGDDSDDHFPVIEDSLESETPNAEIALIEKAGEADLLDCIARLSDGDRVLCGLRMHSELSYEEISAQMNIPLGTVKTKLFRIREKLIKCFRTKGARS